MCGACLCWLLNICVLRYTRKMVAENERRSRQLHSDEKVQERLKHSEWMKINARIIWAYFAQAHAPELDPSTVISFDVRLYSIQVSLCHELGFGLLDDFNRWGVWIDLWTFDNIWRFTVPADDRRPSCPWNSVCRLQVHQIVDVAFGSSQTSRMTCLISNF